MTQAWRGLDSVTAGREPGQEASESRVKVTDGVRVGFGLQKATCVGRLQRLTHMPAQPLSARYLQVHVSRFCGW